jgi:hypothetical protein
MITYSHLQQVTTPQVQRSAIINGISESMPTLAEEIGIFRKTRRTRQNIESESI